MADGAEPKAPWSVTHKALTDKPEPVAMEPWRNSVGALATRTLLEHQRDSKSKKDREDWIDEILRHRLERTLRSTELKIIDNTIAVSMMVGVNDGKVLERRSNQELRAMLGLVSSDPIDAELKVDYSDPTATITLSLRLMT